MTNNLTKTKDLSKKISYDIFFGKNLKFLRNKTKLSAQVIADKIGFSRSQWANYENEISFPKFEDLITIANYFDITETELIHTDLSSKNEEIPLSNVAEPNPSYNNIWKEKYIQSLEELAECRKQLIELQGNEIIYPGTSATKKTVRNAS